jgi:probable DNA metabolism protein
MTPYVFDGSFEGLLTAVFDAYQNKHGDVRLESKAFFQPSLLGGAHEVVSDPQKSQRVWNGLKKKLSPDWQRRFHYAFLGETREIFMHLFNFARYVIDQPEGAAGNYGHPTVIAISKMERSVSREPHRMKAFIRFQETADGVFYAPITPDYNVLPLVSDFFRDRYADQKWLIYDLRRNYGLFYDLEKVEAVRLDEKPHLDSGVPYLADDLAAEQEGLFGLLWQDYFKSTNIPARKNMKLHVRHVPKRYWHLLTEKKEAEALYFIAIVPPKPICDEVTKIKEDFALRFGSRKALRVMPHITLKAPFKIPESLSVKLLKWFGDLSIERKALGLELNGFGAFDNPEHPVVFVRPEPSVELCVLQAEIVASLGNFMPGLVKSTDRHFNPHMTVAYRDLTTEQFRRSWPEYKEKRFHAAFTASEMCLLRHDGTSWKIIARNSMK